jgi:hypothetical protein
VASVALLAKIPVGSCIYSGSCTLHPASLGALFRKHFATPAALSAAASDLYDPCPLCCCRRQFRLLLQRSWRQISRDKAAAMARLMSNLSSAVIFGAIFFRMQVCACVDNDIATLNPRQSCLAGTLCDVCVCMWASMHVSMLTSYVHAVYLKQPDW